MSDRMNEEQRMIAETLDGMLVVDAGPGTGKTTTITQRYLNLISREDVSPKDVLALTFTVNAANAMEEKIKGKLADADDELRRKSMLVQAKTFDAFCLSIVMDSPDEVGKFFGIDSQLTRGANIVQNETLNREWFQSVFDDFLSRKGDDYGKWAMIGSQYPRDLLKMINKLMARGIFPLRKGWFGLDIDRELQGDTCGLLEEMRSLNESENGNTSDMADTIGKLDANKCMPLPDTADGQVPDEALVEAAEDGRSGLYTFVHDVYFEYVKRSIESDRLTFGINAMLAFGLLYGSAAVRRRNSYRYVMIDEFQDTNACQLMIALMVMSEPNLCVVGDWKQGIYGFRFVSIENITRFEERVLELRRFLNDGEKRVQFSVGEAKQIPLRINYRSSRDVVETAFRCMTLPGSEKEEIDVEAIRTNVVMLDARYGEEYGDDTDIRYVRCESKEDEAATVSRCVRDYVREGAYWCVDPEDGTRRQMRLGDIAVLCRTGNGCVKVMERLNADGIPAFLQGDIQIMSTRQGKLALAWLRYVNNEGDAWGYIPIMADMGYTLSDCKVARSDFHKVPSEIKEQRTKLRSCRRRITELLSKIFAFYGMDDDITQAIISVLSTAHRGSLLTISDLIGIIEEDIDNGTTYPVENSIDIDAVTIMTMHKAKGLEFPAVIIPYVDQSIMPSTNTDRDAFQFDEMTGIRCMYDVGDFDGYRKICTSWKTKLVAKARSMNYDEERRLMFVAMSRAKQYETVICGDKPSRFMKDLSGEEYTDIPDYPYVPPREATRTASKPDVSGYSHRPFRFSVHDLMDINPEDGMGGMADADEVSGKGVDYGNAVHDAAQAIFMGTSPKGEYPELEMVREVVERARKADLSFAEMDCILPVDGTDATIRGRIDLIAVYGDRVEIHDYKTDVSDRFESEYEFQLSVYAEAASRYYGRPARCFIDYVSMGRTKEFAPLGMDVIRERVRRQLEGQADASKASQ